MENPANDLDDDVAVPSLRNPNGSGLIAINPEAAAREYCDDTDFAQAFDDERRRLRTERVETLKAILEETNAKLRDLDYPVDHPQVKGAPVPAKLLQAAAGKPKAKAARKVSAQSKPDLWDPKTAKALDLIKASGKEGISTLLLGKELKGRAGAIVAPLIEAGHIKAKGKKRGTRYFAT